MAKQTDEIVPGEVTQAQWDAKYAATTESLKDLGGVDSKDADDLPESATKKWAGEAGATVDQTGVEMVTALEALDPADKLDVDGLIDGVTNKVFTGTDETKLEGIAAGAEVNPADLDEVPDSVTRKAMSDAEKTKLTGVEESATADQSGAEIRDAVVAISEADRKILITEPQSGEFKVLGIHRNAAGNLEYDYDDVPES